MTNQLTRLWRGEVALPRAFWEYTIGYGFLANMASTIAAFAVLAAGLSGALAVAIFFLPLPYNVLAAVGVWRSAERYQGDPIWAKLARVAIVPWFIIVTLV